MGLNIRIPIITPIQGRRFINHGPGLRGMAAAVRPVAVGHFPEVWEQSVHFDVVA